MFKILYFIFMDLLSIPGLFGGKRWNALFHIKIVCPLCTKHRRSLRDDDKTGNCWWEKNWKQNNYSIPRSFGIRRYLKQYYIIFMKD